MAHRLIGEILTEICPLSTDALNESLEIQKKKGSRIGEILVDIKALSYQDLLKGLAVQFDLPYMEDLPDENLKTDFVQKIPIQFLKKYHIWKRICIS